MTTPHPITGTRAEEIVASVEAAIRDGRLAPERTLPPVRGLAHELGLSPSTVAAAYRELHGRGLIITAGRRGTRVSPRPPIAAPPAPTLPGGARDLATGNPDPRLLPDVGRFLGGAMPPHLYDDPTNLEELLALTRESFRADGVPAGSVAVVGGALDGIERALLAHLRPGDRVAVEDPGYPPTRDLLLALGLRPEPVPIDERGMDPGALAQMLRRPPQAIVVVPRAQNPTGAAHDAARASELGALLAGHRDLLVVEDDHAGPVAGLPLHSIAAAARLGRWVVVRSVSKYLGPDLRLALLAGDATTVSRIEGRQQIGTGWVSHVLQRLVVRLWSDPQVMRDIERATATYTARRTALVEALRDHGLAASGRSGMNVWVPVGDEQAALARLLEDGWGAAAGARYRLRTPPAVRITIARMAVEDAGRVAGALAAAAPLTSRTRST